jgi:hypothetical protein
MKNVDDVRPPSTVISPEEQEILKTSSVINGVEYIPINENQDLRGGNMKCVLLYIKIYFIY